MFPNLYNERPDHCILSYLNTWEHDLDLVCISCFGLVRRHRRKMVVKEKARTKKICPSDEGEMEIRKSQWSMTLLS